jgi:cobalt/nickel transport system ATP-binding protein
MDLLDELQEDGTTIILSTHDVELAYSWADEVLLIAGGKLLHHGTPEEVFTDDSLMLKARLTPPALLNLYTELVKRGKLEDDRPPKGVPEMMHLIEGSYEGVTGTIYTADTDSLDEEAVKAIIAEKNCKVGAMGTRPKKKCFNAGVTLDYTYGIIDKAMLAALIGEDTLIFTCGGMLDRVKLRVKMFEDAGGAAIKVVRL